MKISLFTNCFFDKTWGEVCRAASDLGFKVLEVAAGALCGKRHCNPGELLKNKEEIKKFKDVARKYNLEISCFSAMGNPLHPQKTIAEINRMDLENLIEFAPQVGVYKINCFAGCPGASEDDKNPNWIGLAYPPEFYEYLKWQWQKKIIPFWKEMAKKAEKKGIKFGFEMHPGDSVYNTSTI